MPWTPKSLGKGGTARRAPQVLAYPRKDAFEVWFLLQEDGRTFAKEVVFSRVRCHRWPDNEAVLERRRRS